MSHTIRLVNYSWSRTALNELSLIAGFRAVVGAKLLNTVLNTACCAAVLFISVFISSGVSATSAATLYKNKSTNGMASWCMDPTFGMPVHHMYPPTAKHQVAHWIWLGIASGNQQFNTRKLFFITKLPKDASISISADDAFTLFINGHRVARTFPVEQGWSHAINDNVTRYLHVGRNILAVSAVNSGGAAGALVDLRCDGNTIVVSNSGWKATLSEDPPKSWLNADFDDSHWSYATDEGEVGKGVWGGAIQDWPNQLADEWYMAHLTINPVSEESLGSDPVDSRSGSFLKYLRPVGGVDTNTRFRTSVTTRALFDFGRELSGRVEVAGTSDGVVEIHTGETRESCLRLLKDPNLRRIDNSGPWTLNLSEKSVQRTPYTAFRYALVTVVGAKPLTLTKLDCDFKYYPVTYRGTFACSDPLLTRIWYTGAYTAHLCMQEDIWDAPKRDRGLWIGDLQVTGQTINDVFADKFLMEKTIAGGRANAQGGRGMNDAPMSDVNSIPGYSAAWFGVLADFYRHSGDLPFLRSQHEAIVSLLLFQKTEFDSHKLFVNPLKEWDFCDWAPNYVKDTKETLETTDLFDIYGVRQAVFLLHELGDTKNETLYTAWANDLSIAARNRFADKATGIYGDSVQENTMAVYSGVASKYQCKQIYNHILKAGTPAWKVPSGADLSGSEVISPYYGSFLLRAYAELHENQAGMDFLRRYWGDMLQRKGTTWWECFDPSFSHSMDDVLSKMPYLSMCHGWSSGPTSYLTECVLGVQPNSGGYDTVVISPHLGDLTWVAGNVPTPHGVIRVRVTKHNFRLVCTLSVPKGVHATVTIGKHTYQISHSGTFVLQG